MCDPHTVGAVFTHLAEEEQEQACDWNHMQGRQVIRVIGYTQSAELLTQQPHTHRQISVALIADRIDTPHAAFRSIINLAESTLLVH